MSLLRQLVNEEAFRQNPSRALYEAALLVRRSGLVHLVTEATEAEVAAMAWAGEVLVAERAVLLAEALKEPEKVAQVFDGGESRRRALLRAAASRVARDAKAEGGEFWG